MDGTNVDRWLLILYYSPVTCYRWGKLGQGYYYYNFRKTIVILKFKKSRVLGVGTVLWWGMPTVIQGLILRCVPTSGSHSGLTRRNGLPRLRVPLSALSLPVPGLPVAEEEAGLEFGIGGASRVGGRSASSNR